MAAADGAIVALRLRKKEISPVLLIEPVMVIEKAELECFATGGAAYKDCRFERTRIKRRKLAGYGKLF